MIVKCTKTGKILATEEEIKEHAEAFGVASFEEIRADETKLWMNHASGKYCFSKNEIDVFCRRTGENESNFMEITVSEYLGIRAAKQKERRNDSRVEMFAKDKFLSALVDVKGYTVLQAEKALWFTRNESVQKAEEWLKAHAKDEDFNEALKLGDDAQVPESLSVGEMVGFDSFIENLQVEELVKMGFGEVRAKRAVWKTENGGVEKALDWLSTHANDEDIDAALPTEVEMRRVPVMITLSREEAQLAAKELQKKLREDRIAREAAEEKEKERLRILQARAAQEQQTVLEEQKRKREIQERERQKEEDEVRRKELAEKIRLDYIDRFGCEPPPSTAKKVFSPKERVLQILNQIRKSSVSKETIANCLSILKLYLGNISKNPSEKKFQKINMSNKTFVEKVAPVLAPSIELLEICGFQENPAGGGFLEIPSNVSPDGFLCSEAVKYIDVILSSL